MLKVRNCLSLLMATSVLAMSSFPVFAQQRRSTQDISLDELVKESIVLHNGDDRSMVMSWYFPIEVLDPSMKNLVLIAVFDGQLLPGGGTNFNSEAEIRKGLRVTYTDSNQEKKTVLEEDLNTPQFSQVKERVKPIFSKMNGQLGEGLQLFVFKNVDATGQTIVSPYEVGALEIAFQTMGGQPSSSKLELPFNSLFVPRVCPNGKPAHISWKFCPWDGSPLQ